jgi:hypothetical protein
VSNHADLHPTQGQEPEVGQQYVEPSPKRSWHEAVVSVQVPLAVQAMAQLPKPASAAETAQAPPAPQEASDVQRAQSVPEPVVPPLEPPLVPPEVVVPVVAEVVAEVVADDWQVLLEG